MLEYNFFSDFHAFYELLTLINLISSMAIFGFTVYMLRTEKDPIRWGLISFLVPSGYFTFFYGILFIFDAEDSITSDGFIHSFTRPGITTLLLSLVIFLYVLKIRLNYEREKREMNKIREDVQ